MSVLKRAFHLQSRACRPLISSPATPDLKNPDTADTAEERLRPDEKLRLRYLTPARYDAADGSAH